MTPAELVAWRQRMGMTAKAAAEALGLSVNGYAAYERGYHVSHAWTQETNGKAPEHFEVRHDRPIPKHVALACERLEQMKMEEATNADVSAN